MTVQCALLKCYTILYHRDSSVIIPLPPDQHHCSDEAKWRMGGSNCQGISSVWKVVTLVVALSCWLKMVWQIL